MSSVVPQPHGPNTPAALRHVADSVVDTLQDLPEMAGQSLGLRLAADLLWRSSLQYPASGWPSLSES